MKVTEEMKGGFVVRFFGASDAKIREADVFVSVPWIEKDLSIDLAHSKTAKPAEKQNWSLSVKDFNKKYPATAEALVRVFDRSLEYYRSLDSSWMNSLFPNNRNPDPTSDSKINLASTTFEPKAGFLDKIFGYFTPKVPNLREPSISPRYSSSLSRNKGMNQFSLSEGESAEVAAPASLDMAQSDGLMGGGGAPGSAAPMAAKMASPKKDADNAPSEKKQAQENPTPRQNFAETALFLPQLKIKDGKASFQFAMPEQLSSWRVLAQVITSDAQHGVY